MKWFWRIFSISCFVLVAFVAPAYCIEPMTILLVGSIVASLAGAGVGAYGAHKAGEAAEEQMGYTREQQELATKEGKRRFGIQQKNWKAQFKQRLLEAARNWELAQEKMAMSKESHKEGMAAAKMGRFQAGRKYSTNVRLANMQLADMLNRSKARRAIRKVRFATGASSQTPAQAGAKPVSLYG